MKALLLHHRLVATVVIMTDLVTSLTSMHTNPRNERRISTIHHHRRAFLRSISLHSSKTDDDMDNYAAIDSKDDNNRIRTLKSELLVLAEKTNRGFGASTSERKEIKDIIFQLRPLNPTVEPASPYYEGTASSSSSSKVGNPTLAGKWTLVYTDAPDITSLDTSQLPFSTAQLGRIGQECNPPYIKNVIEWKRPSWAKNLPFSGKDDESARRILQKVVTSATASPNNPRIVNLKVAGFELVTPPSTGSRSETTNVDNFQRRIEEDGLIGTLLGMNPIDLKGPWNPPFGQFEVLYLDKDFRIIQTYQNYLAVNQRILPGEEWF